jgi:hypothetical protein
LVVVLNHLAHDVRRCSHRDPLSGVNTCWDRFTNVTK